MKQDLFIIIGCVCLGLVLTELTSSYFNAFIFMMMGSVGLLLLSFSRKQKKIKYRLFQTASIMLIVTIFEVIALLHHRVFIVNDVNNPRYTFGRAQYWGEDEALGYKPRPSTFVRAHRKINGNVVYDTDYSFSSDSLRNTKSNKQSQCAFIFFGGSRVFGEGLPDIQTLPYQFSRKLNYNYNVANYAFHGYGPHQMLRVLETGNPDLSKSKSGVIFYLLNLDDREKISGNLEYIRRGPKYILKEGELKYVGDLTGIGGMFNSRYDFKNSVISLLRQSRLVNLLFKINIGENTEKLDYRDELLLRIINKSEKIAREKYKSKFVIILANEENVENTMLIKLADNNINYIEIPKLLSQDWGEQYFLQDGINFNEKMNDELATGLANRYGDCN